MPPIEARRRWLNLCWGCLGILWAALSPEEVNGGGKLERASRNGGILSSWGAVLGLIDRIPTMIIGTIRPSPSSSSPFWLLADPGRLAWLPGLVSLLRFAADEPNLNIRKKFSGAGLAPGISVPSSASLPLCLRADAILPFCKAWRKLSNVPSSPSAATLRASDTPL